LIRQFFNNKHDWEIGIQTSQFYLDSEDLAMKKTFNAFSTTCWFPLFLIGLVMSLAGCGMFQDLITGIDAPASQQAIAVIGPTSGNSVTGTATFTQIGDQIALLVEINGASPGLHAVHIHQYGDCSAADGTSAGGHWNPTDVAHGKWGEGEFHLGDLGNISFGADGTGSFELTTDLWEMGTGSDVDIVGRGFIVHAGADDFTSQPSGAAGPRVGCGVIEMAAQP
jgi:Cu-Zn family superoxide dismutase